MAPPKSAAPTSHSATTGPAKTHSAAEPPKPAPTKADPAKAAPSSEPTSTPAKSQAAADATKSTPNAGATTSAPATDATKSTPNAATPSAPATDATKPAPNGSVTPSAPATHATKSATTNGAAKTTAATAAADPPLATTDSSGDPSIDTGDFDFGVPSLGAVPKPDTGHGSSPAPPLGVLERFTGKFAGTGFNQIFRPNSNASSTSPLNFPSDNVLELNLTTETLQFSKSLGNVPNRGSQNQSDIFLNGVPYVQAVKDVTNLATGKADGTPTAIHFEPGLWMNVPATNTSPKLPDSLVRMASIPHGTTINAQCLTAPTTTKGPPTIESVDITPFDVPPTTAPPPKSTLTPFPSQNAADTNTARLPQDLSKFIAAGTITQDILTDPNTVLRNAIKGQEILETITFKISTDQPNLGGGTDNIAFLQAGSNANVPQMEATFWVETVQHEIDIPTFKTGDKPLSVNIPGSILTFVGTPPHDITSPKKIVVSSTQIQYSQKVILVFNDLSWPHVSVATLVPKTPQVIPSSAFN